MIRPRLRQQKLGGVSRRDVAPTDPTQSQKVRREHMGLYALLLATHRTVGVRQDLAMILLGWVTSQKASPSTQVNLCESTVYVRGKGEGIAGEFEDKRTLPHIPPHNPFSPSVGIIKE